ncbi:c-type cytochrome [Oleiagrimonas citrea]|uniref:C-type cytochrome n=1 Tax=Oleiagrimonas citrea TaxID=1665687 RepID=A0A846ZNQ9_9GAMM|nr:c-type cytochrome [Oleiagrimonas citrea]NKZ39083.1 c-type cytochrome [Oleiagrimonas citrea]
MSIRTQRRRFAKIATALTILAGVAAAHAATPDAARIAQVGNGRGAAPCSACHGAHGGGQDAAGYPRLAGLNKAYLLKQLDAFASGSRANPVMQPNAKALSVAEREAMAAYYSAMPVPASAQHRDAKPVADDDPGAQLAQWGRWSEKVPACVQCHGPHGVGVGVSFPPLAGQPANYLVAQLKAWKQGTRKNDPLQLMQHVTSKLSEQDMRHVAAWFAAQPINARGETP